MLKKKPLKQSDFCPLICSGILNKKVANKFQCSKCGVKIEDENKWMEIFKKELYKNRSERFVKLPPIQSDINPLHILKAIIEVDGTRKENKVAQLFFNQIEVAQKSNEKGWLVEALDAFTFIMKRID